MRYDGSFRLYFGSETAQVELRSGRHSSTFRLNVTAFCGIGGFKGDKRAMRGCFQMYFVSETAQVELRSGRV